MLPIKQSPVLDALGNATRREILGMLAESPLAVGAIARRLPVSRPAVSKHLRILQQAELVAFERAGNRNIFRLQPTGFDRARDWLDRFWDDALTRFKLVAENTAPEGSHG